MRVCIHGDLAVWGPAYALTGAPARGRTCTQAYVIAVPRAAVSSCTPVWFPGLRVPGSPSCAVRFVRLAEPTRSFATGCRFGPRRVRVREQVSACTQSLDPLAEGSAKTTRSPTPPVFVQAAGCASTRTTCKGESDAARDRPRRSPRRRSSGARRRPAPTIPISDTASQSESTAFPLSSVRLTVRWRVSSRSS